jgi:hypothetical protein
MGLAAACVGEALGYPQREIVALADRAYASLKLLERCRKLSNPITFITRLRLDAALYEPAPPRRPHQMGSPRLKGSRLPNLCVVAQDRSRRCRSVVVAHWYGAEERSVEVVSNTPPCGTPRACPPCRCVGS